eukprot:TRINITY_DN2314_c1_g2_i2.p2 TRINITY_DN2314_c1_g2~~TRINITY_DN2314_c1_g2_i2.p2  ORF type:complete len:187 (-),score=56.65 TRINITY_DN2314_c1_g2_i2:253-813(-)
MMENEEDGLLGLLGTNESTEKKVKRFEAFLNEKLKVDLENVLRERDEVYKTMSSYMELKGMVETLMAAQEQERGEDGTGEVGTLKTMVNIGADVYCQAKVEDPTRIFVNVGFGFHVEMELEEAVEFIDKKTEQLQEVCDGLSKKANTIRGKIRIMMEGINEVLKEGGLDLDKKDRNGRGRGTMQFM